MSKRVTLTDVDIELLTVMIKEALSMTNTGSELYSYKKASVQRLMELQAKL